MFIQDIAVSQDIPKNNFHTGHCSELGFMPIIVSIPHIIAFGMFHVDCKGIPHDHVVLFLAMWYAFLIILI